MKLKKLPTIIQFPNAPLIIALLAVVVGHFLSGVPEHIVRAIFYVALIIWAYEEAVRGDGWFRRGLGVFFIVYVLVSLARPLR